MAESRKVRSDTVDSTGRKKKEGRLRIAVRRIIELLKRGEDESEGPQDEADLHRKFFPLNQDEEWLRVVNSKNYREVNTKTLSRNVESSPKKPAIPATQLLFAQTAKGRPNSLTEGLEVAAPAIKPSDARFRSCWASPTLQPVVLLDKLNNGSSELAAQSGALILNERTAATSKPAERRKFLRSTPKTPTPFSRSVPDTVNGVCSGKNFASSLLMRFGGRRGATSLPIKTRTTSVTDLMQLSDCTMKLDTRARPGTPVQLNGILGECRIRRESGPGGGSSKRKASPITDNGTAKLRRLNGTPEEAERDTRSLLSEDQSEKCEKIVAGVDKVQSSQNGRVVNQSESGRETAESTAETEQETFAGCCKRLVPTLESDFQGRSSRNLEDGDSESTANCNSQAAVSDASYSVSKTSSANPRSASRDVSPSLQPVVVLRKLTPDEIMRSTTERLRQREEELSSEESFLSFSPYRGRKGHRKCNCGKRKSATCALPSSRDRCNGQSSEQESPGHGGEAGVCRAVSRLDYTSLVRKRVANKPRNEESCHRSCNGVGELKIDRICGRNDVEEEYGSDEGSPNSDISSAETVEFPTAKTTPPYTVIASDNRKCCSNGMCRVATPELIGLENPVTSNRCWMNVTLQTLFSMENFMQSMIRAFEDVNAEENSLISCILTLHYARSLGHQECVYEQARKLSEVLGKLNSDYILNDQQDPSEFILWLFNVFEPALEKYSPSWASSLITENFRFEMEERTCCMGCMNYVVKISSFLILMLDIYIGTSKIKNIQEALAAYTSTKNIRRTCSLCGEEKSMVKTAFKSVPRYLIINLKRYSVKEGEVIRDETPVRHSNTLGLEKYSVPNSTINCSKDTKSVAVASPSKYNIGRKSLRRAAGGDYNLIAIIHHSGFSASSGHYVCDVYHASTKKWYSYNDKMVKEICEATLSTTKRLKTGYIYVYQNNNC